MFARVDFREHDGEILQSPLILVSSGVVALHETELRGTGKLIRAGQIGHETHRATHELLPLVRHRV